MIEGQHIDCIFSMGQPNNARKLQKLNFIHLVLFSAAGTRGNLSWSLTKEASDSKGRKKMDFTWSPETLSEVESFRSLLSGGLETRLNDWYRKHELPREFFGDLGRAGVYGFQLSGGKLVKRSAFREALLAEELARRLPGAAIAALAHADLGMMGLCLFGSEPLQRRYAQQSLAGETIMCLGNTEGHAGSDVASIAMQAEPAPDGWALFGTKSFVTNGAVADLAVVTAVADPGAERTRRISMFLVDLHQPGVRRTRLSKQVWVPSDLTRLKFEAARVPADHLLGRRGYGLAQVLEIFTHSRVAISALTLGTAAGAFDLAVRRAAKRSAFGRRIADHQAKSFEIAERHAEIEAARLAVWKACWQVDRGEDFRAAASIAKLLAVEAARKTTAWAADIFGAASVMFEHPIHKFPMDAWGSSLGEGTQDVQKLVIFREVMKRYA
jgi:alkylation response protein AidB-like acyl-CoA dehydrogenase